MEQIFNDIAIPISWPDQTALGDEKWMALLKKAGIVSNLNFKVGHAAILLIERSSGRILYYDFGRYLCPRGYGRTRSVEFDPRLAITTTAIFNHRDELTNMEELLKELYRKEPATHGGGRLLFSICRNISFPAGVKYADQLVNQGPVLYGALARNNNSCSRFVAQVMAAAMDRKDTRIRKLFYPECLKASPTSNVVNATPDNHVYCYHDHQLSSQVMSRMRSLRFQLSLLKDNFTKEGSKKMGCDSKPGLMEAPPKPAMVPEKAQWLGGIGEGAWFHVAEAEATLYKIYKFNCMGQEEYHVKVSSSHKLDLDLPYAFTFHFIYKKYSIFQDGRVCILTSADPDTEKADLKNQSNQLLNAEICN